jgi:general secretion pathway protein E
MTDAAAVSNPQVEQVERLIRGLIDTRAIVPSALERARRAASLSGMRVDHVLTKLGLVDGIRLAAAWSNVLDIPVVKPTSFPAEAVLPGILSPRFLGNAGVLPLSATESEVTLAITDPLDEFSPAAVAARTGRRVSLLIAPRADFDAAFARLYGVESTTVTPGSPLASEISASDVTTLRDLAGDAPAIKLANEIIERAVQRKASDIHIGMSREGPRLRLRIDGILQDVEPYPAEIHASLISRLKVLAELDIAERRRPQDGRIRLGIRGREIDLRLATMPHLDGEGAVLRILDRGSVRLDLSALGFTPQIEQQLSALLTQPHGILLVTGPTGSGKTTTLYAALVGLVRPELNIVSVEDPVEYHIDGVAQIQVQHKIGLDFPTILRAVLRQDPDIIMIGEIRDRETAAIANQAALTGHIVLATLHTNTAAAALPRLVDMGVEPYLLASTVRAALSQRLVRTPCRACCRAVAAHDHPTHVEFSRIAAAHGIAIDPGQSLIESVGCNGCGHTGFSGRAAIAELVVVNDDMRTALLSQSDAKTIEAIAISDGLVVLTAAGVHAVLSGLTTPGELIRVVGQSVMS